jgi:DNA repair/transcription protein MET18/MMS19
MVCPGEDGIRQALMCAALRTLHETIPDFLSRFVAYFDGEKDPRNLMVVFSILKVPMAEWSIGAEAQVRTER